MVVSNLDGNFVYFAFTYSSTFLTAALTYCDDLKAHDLALLSSSTFITCAHGNIFVGPIDLLTPRSSCVSGLYTLCLNFNIIQKYITDDHMLTSSHIFRGNIFNICIIFIWFNPTYIMPIFNRTILYIYRAIGKTPRYHKWAIIWRFISVHIVDIEHYFISDIIP